MDFKGLKASGAFDSTGLVPGEWVVPSFFSENEFVGAVSGRMTQLAEVTAGFDPDDTVAALVARYPGIPRPMLEAMVLALCMALHSPAHGGFSEGARVRAVGSTESMSLVSADGRVLSVWSGFNTEKFL